MLWLLIMAIMAKATSDIDNKENIKHYVIQWVHICS